VGDALIDLRAIMRPMARVFLLSPANCAGLRARMVLGERAGFDLARRLRAKPGAPLGEVFAFVSGLYFRGKVTYALAFASPPAGVGSGALVITPGAGLWPAERPVSLADLQAFAGVEISEANPAYRRPLVAGARRLARRLPDDSDVVLLGSIASDKYVGILAGIFGPRLLFPVDFVGRGDMSRGGLLLRAVREGRELAYAPVLGAVRRGARPPKLPPLPPRAAAAAGPGPARP